MTVGSEPIIVRRGPVKPVHLSAERRIVLEAREAVATGAEPFLIIGAMAGG